MDAEMTLQFTQTSLDPYIRFFQPKLSPFTTAVADGTIRAVGELADIDHLVIDTTVDNLQLKLFDYPVTQRRADQARARSTYPARSSGSGWSGEGTALELARQRRPARQPDRARRVGRRQPGHPAGVLPRHPQLRAAPRSTRRFSGPLDAPVFSGDATIADGRLRYMTLPHSLQGDQRASCRSTRRASASTT